MQSSVVVMVAATDKLVLEVVTGGAAASLFFMKLVVGSGAIVKIEMVRAVVLVAVFIAIVEVCFLQSYSTYHNTIPKNG